MPTLPLKLPFFLLTSFMLITLMIVLQLDSPLNEEDFNFQIAEISYAKQLQLRDFNAQLAVKKSNLKHSESQQLMSSDDSLKNVSATHAGKGGLLVLSNRLEASALQDEREKFGLEHWPMIPPLIDNSLLEYPISSHFGYRLDPIHHLPSMHQGVDFLAPIGTPIVATADGVIIRAGNADSYGLLLEIQHANGFISKYAHTSLIQVQLGEQVKQGQLIAYVGNSGRSTGAHLHYEVLIGNKPIDPIRLLR